MAIPGGTRIYSKTSMPVLPFDKGTLGCWVSFGGSPVMLSNRHVMPIKGQGVWLVNPGTMQNRSTQIVATVTNLSGTTDAALATPTAVTRLTHATKDIQGIGSYMGLGVPVTGMQVRTYGAEAGLRQGVLGNPCQHASPSLGMTMNAMQIIFNDGYQTQHGDSGSPVVDTATMNLVGLIVGNSGLMGSKIVLMNEIVATLHILAL
jgi:hypothetical protein